MWFLISIIVLVLSITATLGWFIYTIHTYQNRIDKDN